jgi:RimJ/RimL family protein N-acetyltransferase
MTDYIIEGLSDNHLESELFDVLFYNSNKKTTWYQVEMADFHGILKEWQNSQYCKVFVALDPSRKVIGLIRIDRSKHQRRNHVAIIGPIVVLPEFQRVGIGSALLDASILYCKEHGITRIEARMSILSTQAIEFFRANSFHKEGIETKAILDDDGVPHDLTRFVKFI